MIVPSFEVADARTGSVVIWISRRPAVLSWIATRDEIVGSRVRCWKSNRGMGSSMEWTEPKFEEICLNCEINSYASAQL
jgi:coenzyme PQQ precursor peptide PqqA